MATIENAQPAQSSTADDPNETLFTVLYIEDNVANLQLMEKVLEMRPAVTLVSAMQGRIGLDIARGQHPDLVMIDLHLPDIEGAEVLRLLRSDEITASIPVAILSADSTSSSIAELKAGGADYYLTKPLDIHELIQTIDTIVDRKECRDG